MKKIGILASHNGSGFENIKKACNNGTLNADVVCIITNNSNAGVLEKAKEYDVPSFVINSKIYPNINLDEKIAKQFLQYNCDYIFCSGYMKMISIDLLKYFENKIVNTHPALLPSIYGGKGMYGRFVHEAVIKNKEKQSGVTIHFVNEVYDDGEIILTKSLDLDENETVESLESRIKNLESKAIIEAFEKLLK